MGSVILFTRNYASTEQLSDWWRTSTRCASPPLLVAVDQEGGRVQRFRPGFTVLPPLRRIGHEYDLDQAAGLSWRDRMRLADGRRAARLWRSTCRSRRASISTTASAKSSATARSIATRGRGRARASPTCGGMRDAGMAATAKHFPGHGAVVAGLARGDARSTGASSPTSSEDLQPYRRLIANGLPAVMVAHVIFEQVDSLPAGFSSRWMQQELRGNLGFDGAIFTDDLSMKGAEVVGDMPQRAAAALKAGCDVLSLCNDRKGVLQVIESLRGTGDPLSQVRMVRLHGKPGPTRAALRASAEWQACEAAVRGCTERPDLKLNS